ncbi:MAG: glycine cleavage system protein [Francisellaceae bacterium]|nr:glycine cleavage system protein [Francisellaceae bacterium]
MKNIPTELLYSPHHEWIREDDLKKDEVFIGLSLAKELKMGEILSIELPEVGTKLNAGDEVGSIESVKAAMDIYSPLSGTIIAINEDLLEAPTLINKDPYGDGWLYKIKMVDIQEFSELMDAKAYKNYLREEEEEDE